MCCTCSACSSLVVCSAGFASRKLTLVSCKVEAKLGTGMQHCFLEMDVDFVGCSTGSTGRKLTLVSCKVEAKLGTGMQRCFLEMDVELVGCSDSLASRKLTLVSCKVEAKLGTEMQHCFLEMDVELVGCSSGSTKWKPSLAGFTTSSAISNLRWVWYRTGSFRPDFFNLLIYKPSYCNFPESRKNLKLFFYPPTLNIICFVKKIIIFLRL